MGVCGFQWRGPAAGRSRPEEGGGARACGPTRGDIGEVWLFGRTRPPQGGLVRPHRGNQRSDFYSDGGLHVPALSLPYRYLSNLTYATSPNQPITYMHYLFENLFEPTHSFIFTMSQISWNSCSTMATPIALSVATTKILLHCSLVHPLPVDSGCSPWIIGIIQEKNV